LFVTVIRTRNELLFGCWYITRTDSNSPNSRKVGLSARSLRLSSLSCATLASLFSVPLDERYPVTLDTWPERDTVFEGPKQSETHFGLGSYWKDPGLCRER
jgi:hypothetical protein